MSRPRAAAVAAPGVPAVPQPVLLPNVILSGASQDRLKLPVPVPSLTASRAGSESGAAAGCAAAAARAVQQPATASGSPCSSPGWWNSALILQDILDSPSISIRRPQQSPDLDNEDWNSTGEDEDQPDPVTILIYIFDNVQQL